MPIKLCIIRKQIAYIFANCLHISSKSLGPRIVPCGIPLITSVHSEKKPFVNLTLCFLNHKKDLIQFIILGSTLYNFNFCSRS